MIFLHLFLVGYLFIAGAFHLSCSLLCPQCLEKSSTWQALSKYSLDEKAMKWISTCQFRPSEAETGAGCSKRELSETQKELLGGDHLHKVGTRLGLCVLQAGGPVAARGGTSGMEVAS